MPGDQTARPGNSRELQTRPFCHNGNVASGYPVGQCRSTLPEVN